MVAGTASSFDFQQYVKTRRALVEQRLEAYLKVARPEILWESMRYSVLSGGKRFRALLCLAAAEAFQPDRSALEDAVLPCACAIEMVHAMSLIHDDLPCMDNDDFRRGQPTNHKIYGEAMALLAGDALLVLASETLIAHTKNVAAETLLSVVRELNACAGATGMVGGQVIDLIQTGQLGSTTSGAAAGSFDNSAVTADSLKDMHNMKTGALLSFSSWSGAALAGASEQQMELMRRFGMTLGLAFQIADDLLDVTGDINTLGKTPGKDEASGKTTWVRLYGMDKSREMLAQLEQEGKTLLRNTGVDAAVLAPLDSLFEYAIQRTN